MPTVEKEKKVEEFVDALKRSKIAFVAEYQGLTVEQVSGLRRSLREQDSEMRIIKNTLAKRAAKEVGYDDLVDELAGPLAFFLGYETVVDAPKIAFSFSKKNENLVIKTGYYAGKLIDTATLKILADLPPMDQLRVMFAGAIASPPKQFLKMISAPLNQLVLTLNALAKKQDTAGE